MDPQFHDDLIAELAAINTALLAALKAVAVLSGEPKTYLENVLDNGSAAIETTNYYSLPEERRQALIAKAQARFADIITSVKL